MKNKMLAPPLSQTAPTPWDGSRDYIRVMLRDVQAEAHVGLHPWERHKERPTRLIVNVEMFAPLDAAQAEGEAPFIDYDHVRAALLDWPNRPHTPLLETLAEEVVQLCFRNPRVTACRVSVLKPDIFNEAAAAGVELYRVRAAS
ncbi:MAG TPA: dihydroneopterin aldolase [Acetobacteraceae bacterium]|nr:dihydroneopterin aldolase [Acetobacteraceae bacterium]